MAERDELPISRPSILTQSSRVALELARSASALGSSRFCFCCGCAATTWATLAAVRWREALLRAPDLSLRDGREVNPHPPATGQPRSLWAPSQKSLQVAAPKAQQVLPIPNFQFPFPKAAMAPLPLQFPTSNIKLQTNSRFPIPNSQHQTSNQFPTLNSVSRLR